MRTKCRCGNESIKQKRERKHNCTDDAEEEKRMEYLHCRARPLSEPPYYYRRESRFFHQPLQAFGGISHVVVRLRHLVRNELRCKVPLPSLFQYPVYLSRERILIFCCVERVEKQNRIK